MTGSDNVEIRVWAGELDSAARHGQFSTQICADLSPFGTGKVNIDVIF